MIRAAIILILLAVGAQAYSAVSKLADAREAARVAILKQSGAQ
jgi:hypothetical protein